MAKHHLASREDAVAEHGEPVGLALHDVQAAELLLDLSDDRVDDAVEERFLVGDVVVERHRLDAELVGEVAHRERLDALLVGECDGSAQHPVLAQGNAGLCAWLGF